MNEFNCLFYTFIICHCFQFNTKLFTGKSITYPKLAIIKTCLNFRIFVFSKRWPMQIAVLGAGMVGNAIALDLASRHFVTAFDVNENNLILLNKRNSRIDLQQADLR